MERKITEQTLEVFQKSLIYNEKGKKTVEKYMRDIRKLKDFLQEEEFTKERLIAYREMLEQSGEYKVSSINSFLAVANHFCQVMGWEDMRIKMLKIQRDVFRSESSELTKKEYEKLVGTAMESGQEKLALILQTLADTGIRISELQFIRAESLKKGEEEICNKGKRRKIFWSDSLNRLLKQYAEKEKIRSGCIFQTRNGKPMDRSNIWRAMKKLCRKAGVSEEKVYPHNLRHLFAGCFYRMKKDLAKLADVLGHCNIETTRLYIKTTGKEHKKCLNRMRMVVTETVKKSEKRTKWPDG